MAVTSLQLTYAEILAQVGMLLGLDRSSGNWTSDQSADVARVIRNGLRKFYYPPAMSPGEMPHQWSFLRPEETLTTTAPYSDGTVEVIDGVVTLTGGTFPSWAADAFFVAGGKHYPVAERGSDTELTLVDTSSDNDLAAGSSYQLRQYLYPQSASFESLDGPVFYCRDESREYVPLERRTWEYLQRLYRDSSIDTWFDEPKYFAIFPRSHDGLAATTKIMALWPPATDVYHLKYRYNVTMTDLDGTNLYPPGGGPHSQTILEAILSEAEMLLGNNDGTHKREFERCLATSISLDRKESTAPTMGVLRQGERKTNIRWLDDGAYVVPAGTTLADIL